MPPCAREKCTKVTSPPSAASVKQVPQNSASAVQLLSTVFPLLDKAVINSSAIQTDAEALALDPVLANTDDDASNVRMKQWSTAERAKLVAILKAEAGSQADNRWKNCVWTTVSNKLKKDKFLRSAKSCKEQWRDISSC
jgi:hypothetical protein